MYSLLLNSLGLSSLEEKFFSLLLVNGPFERRLYQKAVVAKIYIPKRDSFDFSHELKALREYATGNNFKVERIHPVGPLSIQFSDERTEISLVLPFKDLDPDIPGPINRSIHLEAMPPRHFCSLRTRGDLTPENFEEKKNQLLKWVQHKGLEVSGNCRVLINTPDVFWDFFRSFDIQVEVK